ncbi:MAG: biotin/lipoyl-containing protein, partial [Acidimicrobiia bacterium]
PLHTWIEPAGVRVDSGVEAGDVIKPFYDPMLAKVIAHGDTRQEAINRLAAALERFRAQGPRTNRRFLTRVLRHPAFSKGDTTTDFIARHGLADATPVSEAQVRRAAIVAALVARQRRAATRKRPNLPAGWRNVRTTGENTAYMHDDTELDVSFYERTDGTITGTVGDRDFEARLFAWDDPWLDVDVDRVRERFTVANAGSEIWVQGPQEEIRLVELPRFPPQVPVVAGGSLLAPMMGTVISVGVTEGQAVRAGQTLAIIEAMKMEHAIVAPDAGVVTDVLVSVGEPVATDQVVVVVQLRGGEHEVNSESGPSSGVTETAD